MSSLGCLFLASFSNAKDICNENGIYASEQFICSCCSFPHLKSQSSTCDLTAGCHGERIMMLQIEVYNFRKRMSSQSRWTLPKWSSCLHANAVNNKRTRGKNGRNYTRRIFSKYSAQLLVVTSHVWSRVNSTDLVSPWVVQRSNQHLHKL